MFMARFQVLILLAVSAVSFSVRAEETASLTPARAILRVFRSSGWGVAGENRKAVRVLSDGQVECYDRKSKKEETYHHLASIPEDMVSTLNDQIAALKKQELKGEIACFDDLRQYYDTGSWNSPEITFIKLSLNAKCGQERIESAESSYLEGFLDSLYFQCPKFEEALKASVNSDN